MNLIVWHDAEVKITGVSDCIREFYLLVCSWEKILLPLPEITCLSRARYESEQILFKESQARYESEQILFKESQARYKSEQILYEESQARYKSEQVLYEESQARYESEQILFKESQARSSQQMQYAQLKAKALTMVKTSTRI